MADKKISQLTGATTPLAGTEVLPIVQGGSTVKVAVSNLTAGRTVDGTNFVANSGSLRANSGAGSYYVNVSTTYNFPYMDAYVDSVASTSYEGRLTLRTNSGGGAMGDRVVITNDGNVTVSNGNLKVGTAAKGIDFSANTGNVLDQYKYADFTPTWGASSVNPAIGNGTILGSYVRVGKMCMFQFSLTMGSTTTFGTGEWTFTAPFTATKTAVGSVWALDAGTAFYVGSAKIEASSNIIYVWSNNTGTAWSSTQPFTWAANDRIEVGISFTV